MSQGIAIGGGGGAGFSPEPPASVVTGSGSYTIPAGQYGFLTASVSLSCEAGGGQTSNFATATRVNGSPSSVIESAQQIVTEGNVISTSNSFPSRHAQQAWGSYRSQGVSDYAPLVDAYARVLIDAAIFLSADIRTIRTASTTGTTFITIYALYSSTGSSNWSVALFNI